MKVTVLSPTQIRVVISLPIKLKVAISPIKLKVAVFPAITTAQLPPVIDGGIL